MRKTCRILALVLALLIILAIGTSAVIESSHECDGADCPVCAAVASGPLRLSALPCLLCAALFWTLRIVTLSTDAGSTFSPKTTPVSLKVLLLN